MTDEQRAIMEKGAYENVFYTLNRAVEDRHTAYTTVLMTNNHNVFCNAGVMATVLAFMDVYPEVASKIGSDVVRILEAFMDKFAPRGAYYEGPYYAETAINYTVRVLAAMEPVLGTTYGIDKEQVASMVDASMVKADVSVRKAMQVVKDNAKAAKKASKPRKKKVAEEAPAEEAAAEEAKTEE